MAKRKRPTPRSGYRAGQGTGPDVADAIASGRQNSEPDEKPGREIVERRHVYWLENQDRWRFLLDSYEGGQRYRNATYGPDRMGRPVRNLVRHKREYPDPQENPVVYQGFSATGGNTNVMGEGAGYGPYPGMLGADPAATAGDDDYELRRSRTPVPEFVAEAVEIHTSKVYNEEVERDGPADITVWWEDVDGRGTPIDEWMKEVISPLFLVCGNLDVLIDRPRVPEGLKPPETLLDEEEMELDRAVASYILPENMVWWKNDAADRYVECLVREYQGEVTRGEDEQKKTEDDAAVGQYGAAAVLYRHWTTVGWTLYTHDGEIVAAGPHPYGRPPIIRLVDQPKHRTPSVGKSRYECIAEIQREYYNRDSELILSDTLQAHPFLSGPEDFCKSDNTLSVGPGYLLPMKKDPEKGTYQGWQYISPPKDPAESLRQNKRDLVELKDRRACLTKPAGATGTTGSTVGQSGISKALDATTGNNLLSGIAKSLAKAERFIAEYAAVCLRTKKTKPYRLTPKDREEIVITYPMRFELFDATELGTATTSILSIAAMAGDLPQITAELLKAQVRAILQGLDDDQYEIMDQEIDTLMELKATIQEQYHEGMSAGIQSRTEALQGGGTDEAKGGIDPTGQSGGTLVSNMTPSVM